MIFIVTCYIPLQLQNHSFNQRMVWKWCCWDNKGYKKFKSNGRVVIDVEIQETLGSLSVVFGFWTSSTLSRSVLFVVSCFYCYCICYQYWSQELNPFQLIFTVSFIVLLSNHCPMQVKEGRGVERSFTGSTPPHTFCACPKPGTCSSVDVFVCLFIVIRFTLSQ